MRPQLLSLASLLSLACAADPPSASPPTVPLRYWSPGPAPHSSTLALTPRARELVLVHPDSDTVAFVDVQRRTLLRELPLGPTPMVDPSGRWEPRVSPVAVAVAPTRQRAYVIARNSGELIAVDLTTRAIARRAFVCTEPVAVLVAPAERDVFVACAPDRELVAVDPVTLGPRARVTLPHEPGAMALRDDGVVVCVTHPATGAVTMLDAVTLAVRAGARVPAMAFRGHPIRAHGVPRALTDMAQRPGAEELWVLHTLVSTENSQPVLNFESTVFPAISALDADAPEGPPARATITTDSRLEDTDGALVHVISGPRAIAFTPDGSLALVLALNSENLTTIDALRGAEAGFLEDLPGALHDGIVMHPDGAHAFVNARNTGTIVPLSIGSRGEVRVDGAPFASRASDPMPASLRTGQWMFHNANDRYQRFPITVNHWLSCESCHTDGGSSSVTLRMSVGPRDVPDLRAGFDGFFMRTATRRSLDDFWRTIAVEQGGQIRPDDDLYGPYFRALVDYVGRALPSLHAPRTDAARVARGREIFQRSDVGCARCHAGPRFTDSGAGNPSLDLAASVTLHDVGTCDAASTWPDLAHQDIGRRPRAACEFDTPTLRGVARTGPWLHDGSAPTLRDVVTTRNPRGLHGATALLSAEELDALLEYLRSL